MARSIAQYQHTPMLEQKIEKISAGSDLVWMLWMIHKWWQPRHISSNPILQDAVPAGQKMYRFSVYAKNTDSTKTSNFMDTLKH